jgi:long-chain fatty acid transport protein
MQFHLPKVLAIALIAIPMSAANLDTNELLRQFQFNLSNPGAKSLGMGGAFIGQADDASAAEANPAGLTSITRSEATVEFRRSETSQIINAGGFAPTFELDEVSGSATSVSFASVVLPMRSTVFALYYHEPLNFEQSASTPRAVAVPGATGGEALFPGDYRVDYSIRTFGAAAAWRFGPLSVGAGAKYQSLDSDAVADSYEFSDATLQRIGNQPILTLGTRGSASDVTYTAGARLGFERFSIGAVYESGADYDTQDYCVGDFCPAATASSSFNTPDVLGAGISVRPFSQLTVNVDVVNVGYSSLTEGFQPMFENPEDFRIDDATELHVGAQWTVLTGPAPLAIRAGYWKDPAHALRFIGDRTDVNSLTAAIYPADGGDDVDHVSVGLGYLGSKFQINAAYDHADTGDTAAISVLLGF